MEWTLRCTISARIYAYISPSASCHVALTLCSSKASVRNEKRRPIEPVSLSLARGMISLRHRRPPSPRLYVKSEKETPVQSSTKADAAETWTRMLLCGTGQTR